MHLFYFLSLKKKKPKIFFHYRGIIFIYCVKISIKIYKIQGVIYFQVLLRG